MPVTLKRTVATLLIAGLVVAATASGASVRLVKGARPSVDGPRERFFILSRSKNEQTLLSIAEGLSAAGASSIHVILPDVIMCDLPPGIEANMIVDPREADVRHVKQLGDFDESHLSISPLLLNAELEQARTESGRGFPAAAAGSFLPVVSEARFPDLPSTQRASADRLYYQNSEILAGKILVQVVFVESDGPIEDWNAASKNAALAAVVRAMESLEDELRRGGIEVVYRKVDAGTSFEPILMRSQVSDEKQWISDVTGRLGYANPIDQYLVSVGDFNSDARKQYRTDWAVTVFIVNAENDADHLFAQSPRVVGWGYTGGPHMVTPYPAGALGSSIFLLIKREVAHMFWAIDEDVSSPHACGARSGYLNGNNGNRTLLNPPGQGCTSGYLPVDCIMNETDAFNLGVESMCKFTEVMLGISDRDNNKVPDAFDAPPKIVFATARTETLTGEAPALSFRAVSEAVPNTNSMQPIGQRMDYAAAVKDVSISFQGAPPVFFAPSDGKADEIEEEFEIPLPRLAPGPSVLEFATRNVYGAKSEGQRKTVFRISLDYFNFFIDYEKTGLRLRWSMRGETFGARFDLHRRDVNTGDDVIVDANLQPTAPPRDGITPYSGFDRTVVSGEDYEYYVSGTFDMVYRGKLTEFTFSSHDLSVIGPFGREDMMSRPAPNPFHRETRVSVSIPRSFETAAGQSYEIRVATPVTVSVYDVAGRRLKILYRNEVFENVVTVGWDGTDSRGNKVPLGVYFLRAEAGDEVDFKKVVLVR